MLDSRRVLRNHGWILFKLLAFFWCPVAMTMRGSPVELLVLAHCSATSTCLVRYLVIQCIIQWSVEICAFIPIGSVQDRLQQCCFIPTSYGFVISKIIIQWPVDDLWLCWLDNPLQQCSKPWLPFAGWLESPGIIINQQRYLAATAEMICIYWNQLY